MVFRSVLWHILIIVALKISLFIWHRIEASFFVIILPSRWKLTTRLDIPTPDRNLGLNQRKKSIESLVLTVLLSPIRLLKGKSCLVSFVLNCLVVFVSLFLLVARFLIREPNSYDLLLREWVHWDQCRCILLFDCVRRWVLRSMHRKCNEFRCLGLTNEVI